MTAGVSAWLFDADGHDHAIDLSSTEVAEALGERRLLWGRHRSRVPAGGPRSA